MQTWWSDANEYDSKFPGSFSNEAKILAIKTLVPRELTGNAFVAKKYNDPGAIYTDVYDFVSERTFKEVEKDNSSDHMMDLGCMTHESFENAVMNVVKQKGGYKGKDSGKGGKFGGGKGGQWQGGQWPFTGGYKGKDNGKGGGKGGKVGGEKAGGAAGGQRGKGKGSTACWTCGKEGHKSFECWSKKSGINELGNEDDDEVEDSAWKP